MGRIQTWGEAGNVGGPWALKSSIFIQACSGEGRPQCGPHLQAWPHILVPCKRTACLPAPSQLRSRVGTGAPEAPGVSTCFLERVLPEPGSLGATTLTVQGCPVTQTLCAQETPIPDSCTKRSLQWSQPWVTQGLLACSMGLQGHTGQGSASTQARRVAGPRPPHMSAGHGAPLQFCMDDSHEPAYVNSWPPPVPSGPFPSGEELCVLWSASPHGPALPVTLTCCDPNSPNGFPWAPSVSAPVSAGSFPSGSSDDEPSAYSGR